MILIIDNYDSFTYNLIDLIAKHDDVIIRYPDDNDVLQIECDGVVISPGPGHPIDTNDLEKIISRYDHKPILGVCLGAQAINCYYNGLVVEGEKVLHGKVDRMKVNYPSRLYKGLSEYFDIMRYHSLVCQFESFPHRLVITGTIKDCIQSFEHQSKPHFGIQYHPESFACDVGPQIIKNFVDLTKERSQKPWKS
ncbi:anthranilate synthase component II [Staphylococcus massiliensis]|uniref:Anthranilate synthase component II n=1 Tax=Staphylococcus massiliensis S46 TaxID=1229783 RepID=K9AZY1_9STAP|nr:aminodeoxychorismate/anthranilate synthase component II [Staphylococcus massiliensis]EKU47090.1 anthranilate synthase component II [Staphylococcus massiliensis S46]PNZ98527.1 glutamine amidotransferase [Staphylococcus massiliensis CCUG 55927]